jgi:hypothetical protein
MSSSGTVRCGSALTAATSASAGLRVGEDDPASCGRNGSPLQANNHLHRVLVLAREGARLEPGRLPRRSASLRLDALARNNNPKQVQRWLGDRSAVFALATYVHLKDGDSGEGLRVLSGGAEPAPAAWPPRGCRPSATIPHAVVHRSR